MLINLYLSMLNKKLLILFVVVLSTSTLFADGYLRFSYYGSADGLSQNTINTVFKDSQGFMWFGTNDGLNRFDGKTFKVFQQSHSKANSIGANGITSITEDAEHHLWIGTRQNGISIYCPEKDSFAILNHKDNNPESIAKNYVSNVRFIKPGLLLAGFTNEKVDIINTKTLDIKHVTLPGQDSVLHLTRTCFAKDEYGNIWLGSASKGLFLLDTVVYEVIHIPLFGKHTKIDNDEPVGVTDIKILDKNHLIIATSRTGMILFDVINHTYKQISLNNPKDYMEGNYNIVSSLEIINDSVIWATTFDIGLVEYNINSDKATYYNTFTGNNNLAFNGFLSIYKDNQGIVWLGSNGIGLYYFNPQSALFITSNNKTTQKPRLHFSSVRSIYKKGKFLFVGGYAGLDRIDLDSKQCTGIFTQSIPYHITELPGDPGFLWIAQEGGSNLLRLNIQNNSIEQIPTVDPKSPDNLFPFFKILPYNDSCLWLGNIRGNLMLYNYKLHKRVKIFSPATIPGFVGGSLLALYYRADKNQLWIGSMTDGLAVINPDNGKLIYRFNDVDTGASRHYVNAVKTIVEDRKGHIWIGTGNGLYQFNDRTASFTGYFTSDGLPNNTVYAILEDKQGCFWLSTNKGISRFNPENESFLNFDSKFGLQDDEFNANAYFKDSTGFFCLGGIKGITWFYPDKFTMDTLNTKTVITEVTINNKTVPVSLINSGAPLEIPFQTYNVSITFSGLDYLNPASINYRYRINNGVWVLLGNKNSIHLGRTEFGLNKIVINATNTVGQWSKHYAEIVLDFKRPVYLRLWFIGLIVLIIVLLGIAYFYYRTLVLRRRQRHLEYEINKATKDLKKIQSKLEKEIKHKEIVERQLRESNATKTKVFSIIGHDLINPFNALLGFSELLRENIEFASKEELKSYSNVMYHSSHSLFDMVQNILNWSRAQQNKIVSFPEMVKLHDLVQLVFSAQSQHANSKEIKLVNNVPKNLEVYFDRNMLEIIIRNLVSNAIKFSHKNSSIEVSARKNHSKVLVDIKDEGIGMSQAQVENLFNPDRSTKKTGTNDEKGTGLGLLLVKEFINKNKASIHVDSKEGEGTRFTLVLKAEKYQGA